MGFIKNLFHRNKEPASSAPIPSLAAELPPSHTPWNGNLPCVHGPTDGCHNHNPFRQQMPFDPSLFFDAETLKPLTPKPVSHHPLPPSNPNSSSQPAQGDDHADPENSVITSTLPRDPASGCLTSLPRIHKSVPYTLAFYQVHHLLSLYYNSNRLATSDLGLIFCSATTGSNPALSWDVSPAIAGGTGGTAATATAPRLYLEYTLAFALSADLGSWSENTPQLHGRAVSKTGLIGSGYRDFRPCAHTHVKFTSHKQEGKNNVRYAGVNFTSVTGSASSARPDGSKTADKLVTVERKTEWSSEKTGTNSHEESIPCGRCYTDTVVRCELVGQRVVVCVKVYKDCGEGRHPGDERWLSLCRKGCEVQRGEEDFGRMQKLFEGLKEDRNGSGNGEWER
ncbi:hypothetical protein QBC42DRAFT_294516 [Cladorrhinum samala]|uniref:Uncharacterized protein n=1 Tax=Cladorrhinum samala TaxID=585594 RepID=A0AAV9HZX6_9PEZI|nr:hypothetical protein QBC42DRAFT_294516 [Cladorrhinum samala]